MALRFLSFIVLLLQANIGFSHEVTYLNSCLLFSFDHSFPCLASFISHLFFLRRCFIHFVHQMQLLQVPPRVNLSGVVKNIVWIPIFICGQRMSALHYAKRWLKIILFVSIHARRTPFPILYHGMIVFVNARAIVCIQALEWPIHIHQLFFTLVLLPLCHHRHHHRRHLFMMIWSRRLEIIEQKLSIRDSIVVRDEKDK